MRRAFLYADPAAHSLSPTMHRAAFAWAGLTGEYEAVRVTPAELPARITALREQPDVLGVNLSLPHKETVLPLLDSFSDEAGRIGAVNTVIRRKDASLHGHNTDAPGLLAALQDAGFTDGRGPVAVLGAGGAARAAVYVACTSLKRDVYLVNRTRQRAEELAAAWAQPGVQVQAADLPGVPWPEIDLIINSSSAGLNDPAQSPLPDFDFTRTPANVYDMVYQPAQTRLMHDACAAGKQAENGLGMLAHQARLAFQAWTGVDVPAQVFLRALTQAAPR